MLIELEQSPPPLFLLASCSWRTLKFPFMFLLSRDSLRLIDLIDYSLSKNSEDLTKKRPIRVEHREKKTQLELFVLSASSCGSLESGQESSSFQRGTIGKTSRVVLVTSVVSIDHLAHARPHGSADPFIENAVAVIPFPSVVLFPEPHCEQAHVLACASRSKGADADVKIMEFDFNVARAFGLRGTSGIVRITGENLFSGPGAREALSRSYQRNAPMSLHDQVVDVVEKMGRASQVAQGLHVPVTVRKEFDDV